MLRCATITAVAAAALALAACASGPDRPPTDEVGEALQARHDAAVGMAQRLTLRGRTDPNPPCLELCQATVEACESAAAVCDHEGVGDRCHDAKSGCDWTVTMIPRGCRYCLP